jgi:UDP-perosamine 4-acetyltransferase
MRVVGIGAGGHARVLLDMIRAIGAWEIVGLLDMDERLWGRDVDGVTVIGGDSRLAELYQSGVTHAFIGIGSSGESGPRKRAFNLVTGLGFRVVQILHPSAAVSPAATLGPGAAVMASAVVNTGSRIGVNVIINTGAIVEHDCVVDDHAHIATGSRLGGGVHVGEGSHIGIGASIRQRISIGRGSIVGAGAVVVEDVPDGMVVVGVPARPLRKRVPDAGDLNSRSARKSSSAR